MSEKISLKKRQENLAFSLKKNKNLNEGKIVLRVACALDISGSMHGLYSSGVVSDFVGKLLPFGMLFDDNQQIDMWAFNTSSQELTPATADVYDDYVGKCMHNVRIGGGTNYAPVMADIYDEYFGTVTKYITTKQVVQEEAPKKGFFNRLLGKTETVSVEREKVVAVSEPGADVTPGVVFFQTDGENGDPSAVRRLIEENKNKPIYWFMVGVGNEKFGFLKELANAYDNVGFIGIKDLDLTDSELYDKLLSEEFGEWVVKVGAKK